ncbi:hypothetical protein Vafri_4506 [Volvox africanus]|uniref:Uncharacterized protein n=1 Tax=Volvox africanus TaxID=51714 RepID=A0A8J4AUE8_9CHLO|nr:hypothetical protein Vafri_4506 [Volvox africanus]
MSRTWKPHGSPRRPQQKPESNLPTLSHPTPPRPCPTLVERQVLHFLHKLPHTTAAVVTLSKPSPGTAPTASTLTPAAAAAAAVAFMNVVLLLLFFLLLISILLLVGLSQAAQDPFRAAASQHRSSLTGGSAQLQVALIHKARQCGQTCRRLIVAELVIQRGQQEGPTAYRSCTGLGITCVNRNVSTGNRQQHASHTPSNTLQQTPDNILLAPSDTIYKTTPWSVGHDTVK